MKTPTMKQFIENANIPAKLIRATIKQCGGFEEFTQHAADCVNHGAGGGVFGGFIYYCDTVAFAKRHKAAILAYAGEMAGDIGYDSTSALIAGFNCLDLNVEGVAEAIYNPRSENRQEVFNAMAWFCVEEVSRSYVDYLENIAE